MKENSNKIILITGGTGGLGSAVTVRLPDCGYRCIVPYRSENEAGQLTSSLLQSSVESLHLLAVDALREDGVNVVFKIIDAGEKQFYALVHLLGGIKPLEIISNTSMEDWDVVYSLNLRSFFLFAREAMKRFEKTHEGRIISIGAKTALKPSARQSTYGVTKSGVMTLTKILAEEGKGIGVTAIVSHRGELIHNCPRRLHIGVTAIVSHRVSSSRRRISSGVLRKKSRSG